MASGYEYAAVLVESACSRLRYRFGERQQAALLEEFANTMVAALEPVK